MTDRVLIAGIGNIFHGDDAFGVEVAQRLLRSALPEGVRVVDFGIRSYDLAYALMDGYETAVLVDATLQNQPPGTLCLIEPDVGQLESTEGVVVDGHRLTPVQVLKLVRMMGGSPGRLLVVGCEPAMLDPPDGHIGLSAAVAAAVPKAVDMIFDLLPTLLPTTGHVAPEPGGESAP